MNSKFIISIIVALAILGIYFFVTNVTYDDKIIPSTESKVKEISVPGSIFKVFVPEDKLIIDYNLKTIIYQQANFQLNPEFSELYERIGNFKNKQNAVVIYPTFTESAYSDNGFYDYFKKNCDSSCLTVTIKSNFAGEYQSSRAAYQTLNLLNYDIITDIDVDQNPNILSNYDKVILLHNEYVTKRMFDSITSHPNVIYLYPNSLYAEIDVNYENNTISLVRGHGFPESTIDNGFNWEFDNTRPFEFDNVCANWEFNEIDNGYMLNCYPEYVIFKDKTMLEKIISLNK